MNIVNRRNISPEFHAAVCEGLAAVNSKRSPDTVAKVLFTNPLLEVQDGGKLAVRENPHFMGRNINTIVETIKEFAK